MVDPRGSATERILRLAAYLDRRRDDDLTLGSITANVPGYDDDRSAPRGDSGELVERTKEWEALRKMVRRDLEDLRLSFGIVVEFDESDKRYRVQPPFFTADERRALISAAAVVDVEGLDQGDGAEPPAVGDLGSAIDERTCSIVLRVHSHVVALCDAIAARRAVTFGYHGRRRTLEVYAVGVWRNRWYAMGRERESGERRRYRLDRIDAAADGTPAIERLDHGASYEIPDDFDRDDVVRLDPNDWGRDPLVPARVRVGVDHVQHLQREFGGHVVARRADGAVVEIAVRHHASFLDRLLGFREHVRLLEPPELVDRLRAHLQAVAAGERS